MQRHVLSARTQWPPCPHAAASLAFTSASPSVDTESVAPDQPGKRKAKETQVPAPTHCVTLAKPPSVSGPL